MAKEKVKRAPGERSYFCSWNAFGGYNRWEIRFGVPLGERTNDPARRSWETGFNVGYAHEESMAQRICDALNASMAFSAEVE